MEEWLVWRMNNTEEEGSMMLRGRDKSLMKSSSSIDHGDIVDLLNLRPSTL